MITTEITQELKNRLAWVIASYGGTNNFLSYIKESLYIESDIAYKTLPSYQKLALFNYIKTLLQFEDHIILVSPWGMFVDLREQNNILDTNNNSINIEEPYKVYNLDGTILYTVKNHLGIWGESKLDRNLLVNSVNASAYFLKYHLHSGQEQIKLLITNLHSKNSTVSNSNFRAVEETLISNLSIVNNTGATLNLYKTDTNYITKPNSNSFNSVNNLHIIKNNDSKVFNINDPCYIYTTNIVSVEHTKITYPLNNIVFIKDGVSPIFIGSNVDVAFLNKTFNRAIQFSNKPINDVITYLPL